MKLKKVTCCSQLPTRSGNSLTGPSRGCLELLRRTRWFDVSSTSQGAMTALASCQPSPLPTTTGTTARRRRRWWRPRAARRWTTRRTTPYVDRALHLRRGTVRRSVREPHLQVVLRGDGGVDGTTVFAQGGGGRDGEAAAS